MNQKNMKSSQREIIRKKHLAENIVIIDGFPGCGKTLFSPIISSLERVENMLKIDAEEGIDAFINKRNPNWQDK